MKPWKPESETWKKGSTGVRIGLPIPFSIRWAAEHIRTSSYGAPYTFISQTRFRRLLKVDGSTRLIEYALEPHGNNGSLITAILEPSLPKKPIAKRVRVELIGLSRSVFGLDDDLEAAYAVLNRHSPTRRLVNRYHGLRLIKAPDLYEALLITILGQQVSVASAQSQRRRLMTAFGEEIRFEGQTYFGLPGPDRLIDIGEMELRKAGVSRQKSRYLIEMARGVVEGRLKAGCFQGETCAQAVERLMALPGVGRWTAEIVAMRGLGYPDVFPAGDLGLRVAVQQTFGMDHRPSEESLRAFVRRWDGYRSYAAFYLWMTLSEQGYA